MESEKMIKTHRSAVMIEQSRAFLVLIGGLSK